MPDLSTGLADGVSVVIPAYEAQEDIGRCLQSLIAQTLDPHMFDVVVVLNGKPDNTMALLEKVRIQQPQLNLRIVTTSRPGAGRARNLGLAAARRRYTTFIDHDDYVSPSFLRTLLMCADDDIVAIAALVNVTSNGRLDDHNPINAELQRLAGRICRPDQAPRALSFNAAKLVPTQLARNIGYDQDLASGEDMVFFCRMFTAAPLRLRVCPASSQATYFRSLRDNSLSRRLPDADFAVRQRLEVISRLDQMIDSTTDGMRRVLTRWIGSQADFINRYLVDHPEDRPDIIDVVDRYDLATIPHARLNQGLGTNLVIAYTFDRDTKAREIAADSIKASGPVVDIIHRSSTTAFVPREVASSVELDIPITVSPHQLWRAVSDEFRSAALGALANRFRHKGGYERVISVGWDPATLTLAAAVVLGHPGTRWTVDLRAGAVNLAHYDDGPVRRSKLVRAVHRALTQRLLLKPERRSLITWSLTMAVLLADEVLVADEQRPRLIEVIGSTVAALVETKLTVSPADHALHPVDDPSLAP
jgi:glycosyltransferase involved in cell wall biosynthesis